METFENDKNETVVIAEMDNHRLIHSIAKYARSAALNEEEEPRFEPVVKALKAEAVRRIVEGLPKEDKS